MDRGALKELAELLVHSRELGGPFRNWQGADALELQSKFSVGLGAGVGHCRTASVACSRVAFARVFGAHEASSEYSTSGTRSA
ncbi:hypothetical protein C5C17_06275 [Pseudoclavibacter sp. RFBA6]|nr:hypothetical protein C5C17_06275 [Pseudoclavibacter sp. RFBA6]